MRVTLLKSVSNNTKEVRDAKSPRSTPDTSKVPMTSGKSESLLFFNFSYFPPILISSGILPGSKEKRNAANGKAHSRSFAWSSFINCDSHCV